MNKYRIPNLEKACAVLDLVANTPRGCLLRTISAQLAIPRTTALRIVQTLLAAGYLAQQDGGEFVMGNTMVRLGVKALDNLDIRSYARPILKALSAETGESSHLALLNGDKSILVEVADSPHPIRIAARPGTLVELHCSSTGKVFLAFGVPDPQAFCKELVLSPHTKNTRTTNRAVLDGIEETRKRGFAVDDEEYAPGVRCIAAPVINSYGKCIAAVGLTASTATFTKACIPAMGRKIKQAAAQISARLGC